MTSMPAAPATTLILDRVRAYVDGASVEDFDRVACDSFAHQARASAPIRRLIATRGVEPDRLTSWRDIPPIPTGAFAEVALGLEPSPIAGSGSSRATASEIFRSSGTTGGLRSVHRHPFPDLYRQVIDRSFPTYCFDPALLAGDEQVPMLALVPPRSQVGDSSLGFMVEHVMRRWGSSDSRYAFGAGGTEIARATAFAHARAHDGRPALVLATAFALVQWLDALTEHDQALSLPAGSVVFETGGTKGRVREVSRADLVAAIERRLGVGAQRVVREYGMTELTSQLYGQALVGGDPDLLTGPPWVRVQVLEPDSLRSEHPQPAALGEPGLIAVFDLANLGSALHILTEDVGVREGSGPQPSAGIRLLGRASGSQLRGCSLTVEQLIEQNATSSR